MDAIEMVTVGTARAFRLVAEENGVEPESLDTRRAAVVLKSVLVGHFDEMRKEWKDAIDAHVGPDWLVMMVNLQCNVYAREAWALYAAEEGTGPNGK